MLEYRNASYNARGTIDLEVFHPTAGWMRFTASPYDPEQHGRDIFDAVEDAATPYSDEG